MDIFKKMEGGNFNDFQGTDLHAELALSQRFLNQRMAESAGEPVERLSAELRDDNIIYLELVAKIPVVGSIHRRLKLKMAGDLAFTEGRDIVVFHILSGFKLLDRPVINFFKERIASGLPPGVGLTKDMLRVNARAMMEASGNGHLLIVLREVQLLTETGKLIIKAHVRA